ncbi:hypothetical protein KC19_3G200300 [Ceratodon purpureus]|uniref:Uncharacterized protein n=1 Tax=Ceratodon purpureus TaxID=3225 RepID=A0A8T0IPD2_CERPU|nr:hypothetical protein KC19_3G200300 [Ceratodon purpureus]
MTRTILFRIQIFRVRFSNTAMSFLRYSLNSNTHFTYYSLIHLLSHSKTTTSPHPHLLSKTDIDKHPHLHQLHKTPRKDHLMHAKRKNISDTSTFMTLYLLLHHIPTKASKPTHDIIEKHHTPVSLRRR